MITWALPLVSVAATQLVADEQLEEKLPALVGVGVISNVTNVCGTGSPKSSVNVAMITRGVAAVTIPDDGLDDKTTSAKLFSPGPNGAPGPPLPPPQALSINNKADIKKILERVVHVDIKFNFIFLSQVLCQLPHFDPQTFFDK
jgi:hypothetical protein